MCILPLPLADTSPGMGVAFHLGNRATILQGWELHSTSASWLHFSRRRELQFCVHLRQLYKRTSIKFQSTMHCGNSWCIERTDIQRTSTFLFQELSPCYWRYHLSPQLPVPFSSIKHSGGLRRRLHRSDTRANLWRRLYLLSVAVGSYDGTRLLQRRLLPSSSAAKTTFLQSTKTTTPALQILVGFCNVHSFRGFFVPLNY